MTISARAKPGLQRSENVVAVLGPTNTGKTHLAIERMLGHPTGIIGLPLRLLAREVYNRVVGRVGADAVALITGEEKILPPNPRYRVCTVEAMPAESDASFLAVDEIQLAADLERGHVFTDRILNLRGRDETLLLGAMTMRGIVEKLIPGVNVVTRPRMSVLSYSGPKKITRMPRRSAIVAFSAGEVYAIAELIRRQRGGAAVVLGALSPRTRNAQVEIYQSGDVDFLVATDAIGMGLNLDVDHVAFASDQKFDGFQHRRLSPAEFGQVAGRAGRHLRDGTFGTTGRIAPFDDHLIDALENHRFDPIKAVQWRNRDLDFATLARLKQSLDQPPPRPELAKAPPSDDVTALEAACRDEDTVALANSASRVALLWDVCQIPDYRRIAPANHAELVTTLFHQLARKGELDQDWFASQVGHADNTDGDIDALANRIAHIRTWTFAANRPNWLADPFHWQEQTRAIEDRLSDALHDRLLQRFVDRRTSVLMRRLRENAMPEAEITPTGGVTVEGEPVGELKGFRFTPDASATGPDGKALRSAAQKALAGEIERRAERAAAAADTEFILGIDGTLRWQGDAIARLVESDDALKPRLLLLADDLLPPPLREPVERRLGQWLTQHIETLIKPLLDLRGAESLSPVARGIAFRLAENFGVLDRSTVNDEVKTLDQDMRAGLRRMGVRFGTYHIYVPPLLKPAPSRLLAMLWGLKNGGLEQPGIGELSHISASGRTTVTVDPAMPQALYRVVGFKITGNRAIRLDILERLADLIRPLSMWRAIPDGPPAPAGAMGGGAFTVTPAMTSLLGCSGEDFASILRALGYRMERKRAPTAPVPAAEQEAPAVPADGPATAGEGAVPPSVVEGETPAAAEAADVGEPDLAAASAPAAQTTSEEAASAEPATPFEPEPSASVIAASADDLIPAAPSGSPDAPAAGEPSAASPTAAEPAMIEVWRRARFDAGRPKRPERRPRVERSAPAKPADVPAAPPDATATADAPAATPEPARRPAREGRPPRRDGKSARPQPGRDNRERPPFQGRRPNAADGPKIAPRPEKAADPDSPFAALAALKARLEQGTQK